MCESEGQHLIALVGGCCKIFSLFSLSHGTPSAISNFVPPDIETFPKDKQDDIVDADGDEDFIAPPIHRLVIVAIDI